MRVCDFFFNCVCACLCVRLSHYHSHGLVIVVSFHHSLIDKMLRSNEMVRDRKQQQNAAAAGTRKHDYSSDSIRLGTRKRTKPLQTEFLVLPIQRLTHNWRWCAPTSYTIGLSFVPNAGKHALELKCHTNDQIQEEKPTTDCIQCGADTRRIYPAFRYFNTDTNIHG